MHKRYEFTRKLLMQKNEAKKQLMSEPQGLVFDVVAVEMISNEA